MTAPLDWLSELAELEARATVGPWQVSPADNIWGPPSPMSHQQIADIDPLDDTGNRVADARLLVALRNAAPALLKIALEAYRLLEKQTASPLPRELHPLFYAFVDAREATRRVDRSGDADEVLRPGGVSK